MMLNTNRFLVALIVGFAISPFVQAQLKTFKPGDVIKSSEINENFEYLEEQIGSAGDAASAQCSATQDGSNVVISCTDGSSAVVPGYGTVLIIPEGTVGETPDITAIPTGAIVATDANGVLLGEVIDTPHTGFYEILFYIHYGEPHGDVRSSGFLLEIDGRTEWAPTRSTQLHYLSSDCSGQPFAEHSRGLYLDENIYYVRSIQTIGPILTRSRKRGAYMYSSVSGPIFNESGACEAGEFVFSGDILMEYTPAPEILNAAYPVRLEQLP